MTATLDVVGSDRLAVVLAHALLKIHSAREYGTLAGGPEIDVRRCEDVIALGCEQGVQPSSAEVMECAIAYIAEHNVRVTERG